MAYVVAVHGTAKEPWTYPMLIGPFDNGLLAADFASRVPEQYRWNTLYLNQASSNVARQILEDDGSDSDDDEREP